MSLIVPQAGEIDALNAFISSVLSSVKIRLFGTNLSLGPTTTITALLAAEVNFTGYAPVTLTTWSAAAIGGFGAAQTTSTQPSFTGTAAGGTGNLYGYFYTDAGGTKLYGCEKFVGAPVSYAQNVPFNFDVMYTFLSQA